MRSFVWTTVGCAAALLLLGQQTSSAQRAFAETAAGAGRLAIAAITPTDVAQATAVVTRMALAGELRRINAQNDPTVAGRVIDNLQQVYRGIPVEGGGLTVQTAGSTTVSVFGTVFTDITLDPTPALASVDAARLIERAAGARIAFGDSPTLVILPSAPGIVALAYRATVEDAITCYVDARTGAIIRVVDAKNPEVGLGTGALGDQKKMATALINGSYRTKDTLRPGGISTFDTGGSAAAFTRMINTTTVTDDDLASNSVNTWNNGLIVDTHTNAGATFDYFFRRHDWLGLDNHSRPVSAIVHSGLKDNAIYYPAPFGPNKDGAAVFGVTSAGAVPFNVLDVTAHELMHGVTSFSLINRTGGGFANLIWTTLGPSSFVYKGTTYPCATTVWPDGQGVSHPSYCFNGQYVLGAFDAGAINEAFSDVFGTSVEFFSQPAGTGPLKADYLQGEDISGSDRFVRSLSNPAATNIFHDTGTIPYPDHASRKLNYVLMVASGTASNPTSLDFTGAAFSNGSFLSFFNSNTDNGGIHYNSAPISHAFYLAIEGGRNATSGLSVTGVGAQNRAQIEKVFFRAMTQLMPNSANLFTAAAAVIQAATDLYGASGAPTQAVTQAMTAVGLR